MAFVNLPPNLQDIFGSITDRIAKLETGPSSAQTDADTAQATAVSAQTTAISAQSTAMSAALAAASASAQALTAQTTAATAQGMATIADGKAITAQATAAIALAASTVATGTAIQSANLANSAQSTAVLAQSTASIASLAATQAQTTADGKNVIHYSTTTPGTTANIVGDIWYQYGTSGTYLNKVIAEWSGAGVTSWTPVTVSGLVIANIDAGAITTGTLSAIEISGGSGGTAFHVSPTGYMAAQGAYIKGNITADSGTFNGQVNAASGFFGNVTTNNGWRIDATGITGAGSGYISGGAIQGTSFYNGNGTFYVNAAGDMVAQSVYAQGVIRATSGYFGSSTNGWNINGAGITGIGSGYIAGGAIQGTSFNNNSGTFLVTSAGALTATDATITGTITANSGTIGGFTVGQVAGVGSYLYSGNLTLNSSGTITGGSTSTLYYGYVNIGGGTAGSEHLIVTGNSNFNGTAIFSNNVTTQTSFYTPYHQTTASAANGYVNASTGLIARSTASSQRYKEDIVNLVDVPELSPFKLLELPVRAFRFKDGYLTKGDDREGMLVPGFVAEEVDAIYPAAADYNAGQVETWNDRMIVPALLALIQDQEARIKALEAK